MAAATATSTLSKPPAGILGGLRRLTDKYLLYSYTGLAIIYLLLPVAMIILFSFNDPIGRRNFVWQKFSLDQSELNSWAHPWEISQANSKSVPLRSLRRQRRLPRSRLSWPTRAPTSSSRPTRSLA